MTETTAREAQAGRDVLKLKIRELSHNLLGRESSSHQIEDIDHSNAHAADTGSAPTLQGIHGDSIGNVGH